jgi:hypothetical protein
MGSNKSGKQIAFQKNLRQAHASASATNIKKITSYPTPNKGDPGSLTIVAHDTGPLAGKPCTGYSKFSTYIYYSAHEIPITSRAWRTVP